MTDKSSGSISSTALNDELTRRDTLRLLAIALHKLGGKMEITLQDYFAIQGKVFFSTRTPPHWLGTISIEDDKPAKAFDTANDGGDAMNDEAGSNDYL